MQKKYLLNEIKMLIEQNKELQTKINELNNSIKERDSKIESLNFELQNQAVNQVENQHDSQAYYQDENQEQIDELNNKIKSMESLIDRLTRESVEDKDKIDQLLFQIEENASVGEPIQDEEFLEKRENYYNNNNSYNNNYNNNYNYNNFSNDENYTPIDFGEEINYASTQIGKVIVKISEFCNKIASSNNENARELINLALGRGEVFKADVMTVLQSDVPFDEKASIIEEKIKDVDSYIISLYGQF